MWEDRIPKKFEVLFYIENSVKIANAQKVVKIIGGHGGTSGGSTAVGGRGSPMGTKMVE